MAYIGSKPADKALTSDDITDGVISTAKIQDNAVTTAKTSYSDAPFRNIIINGDMSIAQRGTSTASLSSTDSYPACDRWRFAVSGAGTWTVSQSTDVPSGQGFSNSLKLDCTSATASPASGAYLQLLTRFEGQNLQYIKKGTSSAEILTLSFWVKCNKTGNQQIAVRDNDNTRVVCPRFTINSADTWEKKTLEIPADTTGTLGNDNGNSFALEWWLDAGSDFTSGTRPTAWEAKVNTDLAVDNLSLASSTDNEFYITGVQLEAGTTASDFEFLPHDVNLTRCQRYCFSKIGSEGSSGAAMLGASGNARNSTQAFPQYIFPTKMRTLPSLTVNNATGFLLFQTSVIQCTAVSLDVADPYACSIVATVASGLSSPTFYSFGCNSGTSQLIFNAEL